MSKGWVGVGLLMCLCWTNPAQSTPPPQRPALCNGLLLPTSLVAYYVELDSWKDLAVVEIEQLEAERPTFWGKWGERIQWAAIGVTATVILSSTL